MADIVMVDKENALKSFIENKELLERRNSEGIEKYRKGTFTLKFKKNGSKHVTVKQTKHKFLFGCNAFMLQSFEKDEKEKIYKEKFSQLFNQAVVPFYWSDLEPEEGKPRFRKESENIYRRPAPDVVLEFCKEYGIEPKGHCLLWHQCVPEWLRKYSPEQRKEVVERRFKEISEEYADKIVSFDIVNESASHYRTGQKVLFDDYDEVGLQLGAKYFPNNKKILNETNDAIWQSYYDSGKKYMTFNVQLNKFVEKNLPIDEIGLQYHLFVRAENMATWDERQRFMDAENMLEILNIFNAYNLPMHMSEITVPGFFGQNDVNESFQAELTEILYRTWFATENMKSIVWWNLVDGYAAWAPIGTNAGENYYGGGLLRFDMTEKPVYKILDKLINQEWKTSFVKEVNENQLTFRGFYGEYEISVDGNIYKVHLDKDGKEIVL